MGRRKKKSSGGGSSNGWMATFADLVTLMITFFVLLLTMSSMDQSKLKEMFQYFPGASMSFEGGVANRTVPKKSVIPQVRITSRASQKKWLDEQHETSFHSLQKWLLDRDLMENIKVIKREDRFEIHLDNKIVFKKGTVKVETDLAPFLNEVSKMLAGQPDTRLRIEVISTDQSELEIKDSKYESMWELATERAATLVIRLLNTYSVDKKRISMIGYGYDRSELGDQDKKISQRVELVFLENDLSPTQGLSPFLKEK